MGFVIPRREEADRHVRHNECIVELGLHSYQPIIPGH